MTSRGKLAEVYLRAMDLHGLVAAEPHSPRGKEAMVYALRAVDHIDAQFDRLAKGGDLKAFSERFKQMKAQGSAPRFDAYALTQKETLMKVFCAEIIQRRERF